MLKIAVFATILVLTLAYPPKAHAIIFLPAVILIPIAKLVAIIMGGFSIPALALGTLWSKLFKKSVKRTLFIMAISLIFIGFILIVVFKIANPLRPLI